MVNVNIDIVDFLKFGKINGREFVGKRKEALFDFLTQPEEVEEHLNLGLTTYYYGGFKFLVSQNSIIESIVVDGNTIKNYYKLARVINLLMLNNIDFNFDKARSDNDYLFVRVGEKGQAIFDIETEELYKLSYPYL